MQGQYRTAHAGGKCTFGRQACTFHRRGRHRHETWQAQSSRDSVRWLPSGFLCELPGTCHERYPAAAPSRSFFASPPWIVY
ncbi:hypothetical protein FRT60_07280 [Pseudomonas haemolytica]|uniref:Uncharacterized protein n=1 Tax=Pseudomonas haemolytica TaxID=2600065 RepID=A0A646NVK6_9PSED|nr:hypothetical protein [Pseudomonas haemolytica]